MNQLTIVFLEKLSERVSITNRMVTRIQKEMSSEGESRLHDYLLGSTRYMSPRGIELSRQIQKWLTDVRTMECTAQARSLLQRLVLLEHTAQDLRLETKEALSFTGRLDPDRIHIVFGDEVRDVTQVLFKSICLELYRIVASVGGQTLATLPLFSYVHPTLEDYYQYYTRNVYSNLMLIDYNKRFGLWAYQYKDQMKLGAMSRLPGFVRVAPRIKKNHMILGEHHVVDSSTGCAWQGIGVITNITPATVADAQKAGIHAAISMQQLKYGKLTDPPQQVLDRCFGGGWYAIDPAHYFATLTIAMCAETIKKRKALGQCLYCGSNSSELPLCTTCLSKVRQKL